jgi:Flp pilus assembly protein TadD
MGIADSWALMTVHGQVDPATGIARGEAAAEKAIALDPDLAEAHAALGLLKGAAWDARGAEREYQRAIQLNPSYDRAYVREGTMRFVLGDFTGAERLIRQAETLNPDALALPLIRAELYHYWRRYNDSINLARQIGRVAPHDPTVHKILMRDFIMLHRPEEALAEAAEIQKDEPNPAIRESQMAAALAAAGRTADARRLFDEAMRVTGEYSLDPNSIVLGFANMGDRENTLKWLRKALDARAPDIGSDQWDPALDFVRNDPEYRAIFAAYSEMRNGEPANPMTRAALQ